MPAAIEDALIEVGGVARRLGVSAQTVRNLVARGEIPAGMRLERTGYRVWRESVIEAIQERRDGRRREASGEAA